MLGLYDNKFIRLKCAISLVSLISFTSASLIGSECSLPARAEYDKIISYFEMLSDKDTVDEAIEALISFRTNLIERGFSVPLLSVLTLYYWDALQAQGVKVDETVISTIYWKFLIRELNIQDPQLINKLQQCVTVKHHHHHKKKEKHEDIKISGKMAFGFLKFMSGCLCCIVPFPAVEAIGVVLAGNGINDMIDAAREEGEKREAQ
jgi:hypothetical protein